MKGKLLKDHITEFLLISAIALSFYSPTISSSLVVISIAALFSLQKYLDFKKLDQSDKLDQRIKQLEERMDNFSLTRMKRQ